MNSVKSAMNLKQVFFYYYGENYSTQSSYLYQNAHQPYMYILVCIYMRQSFIIMII